MVGTTNLGSESATGRRNMCVLFPIVDDDVEPVYNYSVTGATPKQPIKSVALGLGVCILPAWASK